MEQGHYFGSSIAEWRVNENKDELIKGMKKYGYSFTVYFVPLPIKAHYKIRNYQPVVEGCEPVYQHVAK